MNKWSIIWTFILTFVVNTDSESTSVLIDKTKALGSKLKLINPLDETTKIDTSRILTDSYLHRGQGQ